MSLKFKEVTWKTLIARFLEKDMKMHMRSQVKVRSLTTYHILLIVSEEIPIEVR